MLLLLKTWSNVNLNMSSIILLETWVGVGLQQPDVEVTIDQKVKAEKLKTVLPPLWVDFLSDLKGYLMRLLIEV